MPRKPPGLSLPEFAHQVRNRISELRAEIQDWETTLRCIEEASGPTSGARGRGVTLQYPPPPDTAPPRDPEAVIGIRPPDWLDYSFPERLIEAEIRRMYPALAEQRATAGGVPSCHSRRGWAPPAGVAFSEVLISALEHLGKPSRVIDLADLLLEAGEFLELDRPTLRSRIGSAVTDHPELFRRVRNGIWGLQSWGDRRDGEVRARGSCRTLDTPARWRTARLLLEQMGRPARVCEIVDEAERRGLERGYERRRLLTAYCGAMATRPSVFARVQDGVWGLQVWLNSASSAPA